MPAPGRRRYGLESLVRGHVGVMGHLVGPPRRPRLHQPGPRYHDAGASGSRAAARWPDRSLAPRPRGAEACRGGAERAGPQGLCGVRDRVLSALGRCHRRRAGSLPRGQADLDEPDPLPGCCGPDCLLGLPDPRRPLAAPSLRRRASKQAPRGPRRRGAAAPRGRGGGGAVGRPGHRAPGAARPGGFCAAVACGAGGHVGRRCACKGADGAHAAPAGRPREAILILHRRAAAPGARPGRAPTRLRRRRLRQRDGALAGQGRLQADLRAPLSLRLPGAVVRLLGARAHADHRAAGLPPLRCELGDPAV
mmetsp:Transcript_60659/g.156287  ORF Transcript_60659/g.156287 Transcript_60659/m.156287 type:complete len:307 (-) Transcript_60659:438-1358(-)